MQQHTEVVVVT